MVSDMNLKSSQMKALFDCMLAACGCTGSIYKFGFAMLFGMIAYWFKWRHQWLNLNMHGFTYF